MDEGDKTDQYIEKALSEFRLHGDRKNPYYAAALNGLGGILYQKAAYEKAAQVYHEAAAYLLKFYGKTHEYAITGSMRLGPCVAWEGSKTPVKPFWKQE